MQIKGNKRICYYGYGVCLMILSIPLSVHGLSLPGIWRLISSSLPYEQDIKSKLLNILEETTSEEILIKLNSDGSFRQCNEGYIEGRWMSGRWEESKDEPNSKVVFAFRRQYFGPRFDVILDGKLGKSTESGSLEITGTVKKGKFMYPFKHPTFFENIILVNETSLGSFVLEQQISSSSILPETKEEINRKRRFQPSDFYDRHFILTIEPLVGSKRAKAAQQELNLPIDIRSFPIHFYRNETFQAWSVNKILRGRFQIINDNELAFDVSLFGAGRSSPGSVFSEGIGLVHEDKRSYIGSIIEKKNEKIKVQGAVFFGTDLGTDARPEPCGKFFLTEDDDETLLPFDDIGDEKGDLFRDSIFE